MNLIIEIDKIEDASKREWLLSTLKLMDISFETVEKPQSLEEYNLDLEEGDKEIERGNFILANDLKAEDLILMEANSLNRSVNPNDVSFEEIVDVCECVRKSRYKRQRR